MASEKPVIISDHRERDLLSDIGSRAIIEKKHLEVGDYVCSERVCIERKSVQDFLSSITDHRIFKQLEDLSSAYESPVLIIEGDPESLFIGGLHENVIRGVLSSIAIDYRIPIIWTLNPKETAMQIFWMANREQMLDKRPVQIRGKRKPSSLTDQQLFLVSGLPGINKKRAEKLLKKFRTPEKVFRASEKRLVKVDGFGEKTVKRIKHVLNQDYAD